MGRRMRRLYTNWTARSRHVKVLLVAMLLLLCAPGFGRAAANEGAGAGVFLVELTDRALTQLTEPGLDDAPIAGVRTFLSF